MTVLQRSTALLAALALLGGCANWTIAPVGHVETRTRTTDGEQRVESVFGLLALPTPSHRTVLLLPLFKSSRLAAGEASQLPPSVQSWLNQPPAPLPPAATQPDPSLDLTP